jgi:arsenite methyltransferase
MDTAGEGYNRGTTAASNVAKGNTDTAGEAYNRGTTAASNVAQGAMDTAGEGYNQVSTAASNVAQGTIDTARNVKDRVSTTISNVSQGVIDTAGNVKDRVSTATSNVAQGVTDTMGQIHTEVVKRNYGAFPCPEAVEDCNVLDLGSDTGRDAFGLSKLVGPKGKVVGIDTNQEQIDVANKYVDYYTKQYEYESPNVEFKRGAFEDLKSAGIQDNFFDVVVSNFIINNVSEKKNIALAEAYRVLKDGGEIYFTDIYSDKEIPEVAKKDEEASDYLRGALCWKDLHKISSELGLSKPILVSSRHIPLKDEKINKIVDGIHFVSATYRIFKVNQKAVEESGKAAKVTYKGTIIDHEKCFKFAEGLVFPTETSIHVDSNLAAILTSSRFQRHFYYEPSQEGAEHDFVELQETDPFSCAEPPNEA